MLILVSAIHVLACIILILVILLQTGKGSDLGAMLGGGGSNTLFGGGGASTFLSKMTTVVAVLFMFTCLILAYLSAHETSITVDGAVPQALPGEQQAPAPVDPTNSMQADQTPQQAPEGEAAAPAAEAQEAAPVAEGTAAPVATDAAPAQPAPEQPAAAEVPQGE